VTFTLSSRSTSLSGDGRKSSTILTRPISPLLRLPNEGQMLRWLPIYN
jgi:hypothetical protein